MLITFWYLTFFPLFFSSRCGVNSRKHGIVWNERKSQNKVKKMARASHFIGNLGKIKEKRKGRGWRWLKWTKDDKQKINEQKAKKNRTEKKRRKRREEKRRDEKRRDEKRKKEQRTNLAHQATQLVLAVPPDDISPRPSCYDEREVVDGVRAEEGKVGGTWLYWKTFWARAKKGSKRGKKSVFVRKVFFFFVYKRLVTRNKVILSKK